LASSLFGDLVLESRCRTERDREGGREKGAEGGGWVGEGEGE
jgi:hypothetical protein